MRRARTIAIVLWVAATYPVLALDEGSALRALWPAIVSMGVILTSRSAALGLGCGVAAGALLLAGGVPVAALRLALAGHLLPSVQGPWRTGALVFTLLLGAFAGILEKSGGFETLLRRILSGGGAGARRLLGGTWLVGMLCFFDGLASSLLAGRIARPMADRAGVSRERLAWVVDSTGSPVACVAFISTWIATQLSLIQQGLESAPFRAEPYAMFFQSIPANAYCLLTLMLVPLAIFTGYQPRAMRKYQPVPPGDIVPNNQSPAPVRTVLAPLVVLVAAIVGGFPLLSPDAVDVLSAEGWKQAFSSDSGPYALVAGSLLGLAAAVAFFPAARRHEVAAAAVHGAGSLLPALVVLVLAWTLGGIFQALGAADRIAALLATGGPVVWLPLWVFLLGSAMAFTTGSSWGTMGLLMPLALPATLAAGTAAGLPPAELQALAAMVIGAVFGGATLGDHCSPFSDTTIVSALASGCTSVDHVLSQLPFAALAATAAIAAYALMAAGLPPTAATLLAGLGLTCTVLLLKRARPA
jgi:tetracycline resistance efflux pump